MSAQKNARKKKIDAICQKIAMFIVEETYTDEGPIQVLLGEAVAKLDEAAKLCVESDLKNEKGEA